MTKGCADILTIAKAKTDQLQVSERIHFIEGTIRKIMPRGDMYARPSLYARYR